MTSHDNIAVELVVLRRNHPQSVLTDLCRACPACPLTVDNDVARHGGEPDPLRSAGGIERLRMPPRPEQRLLNDVLGPLTVTTHQPEHIAEQRTRVLGIERPDQLVVSGRASRRRRSHTPPTC